MDVNTIKGHGFKVGDMIEFYGMGRKHDLPAEEPTIVKVTKVGTAYMLVSITDELLTWEFGASAKVWAAPVPTESPAPVFSETDASTWNSAPAGYEWRVVDAENGELHLFAPDGRNVSEACYAAASAVPVSVGDMVEDRITDGALDFIMALVDQDMKLRGHATPQDARTAKISAPAAFRLGRGKRKASKRQARRNRGVSK